MKFPDLLLKERTTTIGLDNKRFPLSLPPVAYRAECLSRIMGPMTKYAPETFPYYLGVNSLSHFDLACKPIILPMLSLPRAWPNLIWVSRMSLGT